MLSYVEARIDRSLAELYAGDDGTSAEDDTKVCMVCMVWVVSPTSRKHSNVATSGRHRSFFAPLVAKQTWPTLKL